MGGIFLTAKGDSSSDIRESPNGLAVPVGEPVRVQAYHRHAMSLLRRARRRFKQAAPEARNHLYRRRCAGCGFLGAVSLPDSSRALADLGEVKPMPRQQWMYSLRTAREMGKLHGSEYDPVMGQDLGLDEGTPHGVMCGLGRPEGPHQPTFVMPMRKESGVLPRDPGPGFVIRVPDSTVPSPFGRVVAAVQTPVWPLVRPHSCPAFMKYREGLTPAKHVTAREGGRRWRRDALVALGGVALGALLKWWLGG
jgi:hypothetical protein